MMLTCGLLDTVADEVKKLKSWFDSNKLTLNLSKTKFTVFGNMLNNSQKKLKINNTEIERVKEIQFLGVTTDK